MIRTPDTNTPKPDSGVDYHTVKAWFQQCRDMAAAVEAQKQKIQRIRDVAEKCTQSLSGMPAGGGNGDKVGLAATDITDEQRRLQQMETDLCLLRIEATRRAYCITASKSSKKQADCLCLYYVKNKKQREVCEELGLSEENQVSIYIKWGSIYLAEITGFVISLSIFPFDEAFFGLFRSVPIAVHHLSATDPEFSGFACGDGATVIIHN